MPLLDITPLVGEILKGLEPVIKEYAQEFKEDAQANAPVLTGALKSSFDIINDGGSRRNWAGEERYYTRVRVVNRIRYSPFQETGSVKNTAKRFMRRSYLRNSLAFGAKAESVALEITNKFNSKVS